MWLTEHWTWRIKRNPKGDRSLLFIVYGSHTERFKGVAQDLQSRLPLGHPQENASLAQNSAPVTMLKPGRRQPLKAAKSTVGAREGELTCVCVFTKFMSRVKPCRSLP